MADQFINYIETCNSNIFAIIFTSYPCILMDKNTWLVHFIYAHIKKAYFFHF